MMMLLWAKENWKVILGAVVLIALLLFMSGKAHNAQQVLDATVLSGTEQILALKQGHDEELKKRDVLIQEHENEIKSITEQYEQQSQELAKEKAKKVKVIVKYYQNDPALLEKKIIEIYEFTKYEK